MRIKPILLSIALLLVAGCAATFDPRLLDEVNLPERAQTQARRYYRVTAAVLSAGETEQVFGFDLYKKGIQPVWLEIQKKDSQPVWFLPAGLDSHYFTPLEASYLSRSAIREADHEAMDTFFFEQDIGNFVAPGKTVSGFIYTNLDEGTKAFNVDVIGEDNRLRTFTFFIPVPGIKVDHQEVDWENLYPAAEVVDHDETRGFLIQDLWYSQGLKKLGYVKGVGAASPDEPRGNLTGDPYFTDGFRAIMWVSSQPSAFDEVDWFEWELPEER